MVMKIKSSVVVSPKFSFKGWSFKEWAKRNSTWCIKNKDTVKSIVSVFAAVLVGSYGSNAIIQALFGIGGGYGTRLILDSIDYFVSTIEESP